MVIIVLLVVFFVCFIVFNFVFLFYGDNILGYIIIFGLLGKDVYFLFLV